MFNPGAIERKGKARSAQWDKRQKRRCARAPRDLCMSNGYNVVHEDFYEHTEGPILGLDSEHHTMPDGMSPAGNQQPHRETASTRQDMLRGLAMPCETRSLKQGICPLDADSFHIRFKLRHQPIRARIGAAYASSLGSESSS